MLTVLRSIGECGGSDTTDLIRELDAKAKCQTMAYYCVCELFSNEQMIRGMCCDSNGKCDCCRQDPTILKMPPLLQHYEPTPECEALLIQPSQFSYCAWSEGAPATACCKQNYKFVPLKREQIGGGLLWEERNHAKCLGLPKLEQRQPLPGLGDQERNTFVCAAKVYTVPRLSSTVKNAGFASIAPSATSVPRLSSTVKNSGFESVAPSATSALLIGLAPLIMHSAFFLVC
uniref:DB domain-containing protein n=1 Tax=Globodera pallida TaxID=36090 RepID=A0A183BSA1_GLOPA